MSGGGVLRRPCARLWFGTNAVRATSFRESRPSVSFATVYRTVRTYKNRNPFALVGSEPGTGRFRRDVSSGGLENKKLHIFVYKNFSNLCVNCVPLQNCLYIWVRDHRQHHKYSDTNADPHNATRGFFFSHMGWLMVRKHRDVIAKGKNIDMFDLESDPFVMFQKQ